jgi:CHAT domain-containing protein
LRKSILELENDRTSAKIRAKKDSLMSYQSEGEIRLVEQNGSRLALLMVDQGRLFEAESIQRDYLKRSIIRTGGHTTVVAGGLINLSTILAQQGRYSEAEQLVRLALTILDTIRAPVDSKLGAEARKSLARTLVAQGRYTEAIAQYDLLRQGFANASPVLQRFANGGINYALAAIKTGQSDAALATLDDLIPRSWQTLGPNALDTVELMGAHAMALALGGKQTAALTEYRAVQSALLNAAISRGDEPSPLRSQRLQLILESYLGLLADIHGTTLEKTTGIDAAGEAFRLVDALRSQSTQAAVAAAAARAAANDPAIGSEIRKEQDLSQELVSIHRILRDLMSAPTEQQLSKVIADMHKRIEGIKKERIALQQDIEQRFPAYANLIRPQPPSLADTRAVLRDGEALINLFTTEDATYIWVFKKDGPVAFTRARVKGEELARMVQTLRRSLDPGAVDLISGIPNFNLDTAYRLYATLLAPVATGWQGATHFLVAANGALSQLPLAVLPTTMVAVKPDTKLSYGQYKDVPWLIRQVAFTQLPSVNALLALRKQATITAQRSPFIGFGDPQFSTAPVQVASASSRGRLRNLKVARLSKEDVEQAKPVDWMDYSQIPPLPDTRDEIIALAYALKADPDKDVFLGSQASRTIVKKLDLSQRRVVAFATHGLLAGDFPGVSEPALALANPGGGQHGLLTLEDILGLKLNADLVVLSACNTAAGDGQGADALSGLGRGFLYAGSRALLVTHWPVESGSARLLVTGIFERQVADAKLTRAEALRQSMLALMQQKNDAEGFSYAHPLFWAPYALIGEGGV